MMRFIFCVIALLSVKHIIALSESEASQIIPDGLVTLNFTYLPKWLLLEKRLKDMSRGFLGNVVPLFIEVARQRNISSQCFEQSMQVFAGMEDLKMWAMRFLDSSAKPFDRVLDTTVASFGRYQQCVATTVTAEELGREEIQGGFSGQYCMFTMKPHISDVVYFPLAEPIDELKSIAESDSALNIFARYSNSFNYFTFLFGICVPSGCNRQDIDQIASYVGEQNGVIINSASCEVMKVNKYTPTVISILFCYGFIVLLVIIGTFLELHERRRSIPFSNTGIRILLSFSIILNFKNLFSTKISKGYVRCLDGFRVISIFWVILCHAFLFRPPQIFHNVLSLSKLSMSFAGQIVQNGSISVDTFFFIGGFLIGNIAMKHKEKMKKFISFRLYLFYRICRIYPALIFTVSFVFLTPLLSSGPIWNLGAPALIETCDQNWWTILLFINNLYYRKHLLCMPTLWYVACDMQLYILAFGFLILIFKKNKLGTTAAVIAILVSMIYIGLITYFKELAPTITFTVSFGLRSIKDYSMNVYFVSLDHLGPHLIGLLSGITMANKSKLKLSKLTLTLGWLLAMVTGMCVVFGTLSWNQGKAVGIAEGVIFASCSRVAWAMCLAWLVICCTTGHGGIVNDILSWKMWIPLSRLTFVAYLIHPFVILLSIGDADTVLPSTSIFLIRTLVADITITYLCAIPIFLMVESPCASMVRLLLSVKADNRQEAPTESGQ